LKKYRLDDFGRKGERDCEFNFINKIKSGSAGYILQILTHSKINPCLFHSYNYLECPERK